jgi:hypothetical protein
VRKVREEVGEKAQEEEDKGEGARMAGLTVGESAGAAAKEAVMKGGVTPGEKKEEGQTAEA